MTIENFKQLFNYLNNHIECIYWISNDLLNTITFKIDNTYYEISLLSDNIKITFNGSIPVRLSLIKKESAELSLMFETLKDNFMKSKEEELINIINK